MTSLTPAASTPAASLQTRKPARLSTLIHHFREVTTTSGGEFVEVEGFRLERKDPGEDYFKVDPEHHEINFDSSTKRNRNSILPGSSSAIAGHFRERIRFKSRLMESNRARTTSCDVTALANEDGERLCAIPSSLFLVSPLGVPAF